MTKVFRFGKPLSVDHILSDNEDHTSKEELEIIERATLHGQVEV
jgi:hypothetical protein